MEDPITDNSKILEMKMRWQLMGLSEDAFARKLQDYISHAVPEAENDPSAYEKSIFAEREIDMYRREFDGNEAREDTGNIDYKTVKAGYEAYRQILNDKEEEQKAFSLDRKG